MKTFILLALAAAGAIYAAGSPLWVIPSCAASYAAFCWLLMRFKLPS